ncbi:unnamed protein product [Urochloa humidicola]
MAGPSLVGGEVLRRWAPGAALEPWPAVDGRRATKMAVNGRDAWSRRPSMSAGVGASSDGAAAFDGVAVVEEMVAVADATMEELAPPRPEVRPLLKTWSLPFLCTRRRQWRCNVAGVDGQAVGLCCSDGEDSDGHNEEK